MISSNLQIKPITDKPTQPGRYGIIIENIKTLLPVFVKFDGESWVDLDSIIKSYGCNDISKVSYYDIKS